MFNIRHKIRFYLTTLYVVENLRNPNIKAIRLSINVYLKVLNNIYQNKTRE